MRPVAADRDRRRPHHVAVARQRVQRRIDLSSSSSALAQIFAPSAPNLGRQRRVVDLAFGHFVRLLLGRLVVVVVELLLDLFDLLKRSLLFLFLFLFLRNKSSAVKVDRNQTTAHRFRLWLWLWFRFWFWFCVSSSANKHFKRTRFKRTNEPGCNENETQSEVQPSNRVREKRDQRTLGERRRIWRRRANECGISFLAKNDGAIFFFDFENDFCCRSDDERNLPIRPTSHIVVEV